jgi:hypothetical protein
VKRSLWLPGVSPVVEVTAMGDGFVDVRYRSQHLTVNADGLVLFPPQMPPENVENFIECLRVAAREAEKVRAGRGLSPN